MENMTVREGHQVKKGKKAILALLLTGSVLAGGIGTMTILAENGKDTPPAMGESVPLRNLVIKFLAIPELEPNRYTKSGSGKFAPEEMEKGLLIGAEMKYGPGNPEGMMAPLKHSLADIAADLTFDTGTGEIVIKYNDLVLTMSEGGSEAVLEKNGEKETLTIPEGLEPYFVEIEGETTPEGDPYMVCYLPVKFTAEALGANVSWDDDMHRLIMAFALYYTDSAVEPVINEKSEYTTKKMEKDSYSYDKLSKIASSSNATPASTSKTKAKDDLIQAAVSVVNEKYQNDDGGWGKTNKDYDLLSDSFAELYGHAYSTFDNGATGGHIKFLARLLRVARERSPPESRLRLRMVLPGGWTRMSMPQPSTSFSSSRTSAPRPPPNRSAKVRAKASWMRENSRRKMSSISRVIPRMTPSSSLRAVSTSCFCVWISCTRAWTRAHSSTAPRFTVPQSRMA